MLKKDPLQIITFQSYGTQNHVYLRGRALEDEMIDLEEKGFFKLLKNTWKRFETDEVKNERLKVRFANDKVLYIDTDREGYFLLDEKAENLKLLINEEGWLHYEIGYDKPQTRLVNNDNRFGGEMLIPSETAQFGIISDIDDTVLQTGVVSKLKWKVLTNSFFKNAESRTAFEGAPELYQKLHRGASQEEANPIFYVSNSPWNLYRYLEHFIAYNRFPKGPLLLRDFNMLFEKKYREYDSHKAHEIKNILKTYPELQFVLIGDAGEHDTDIYLHVVKNHPERIKAIYIRTVNHKKRMLRIQKLIKDYTNVPVVLFQKSEEVEEHARNLDLLY